ncbi:MAG: hypothetical protein VB862_12935 [Pirellulaceae bacterium]
MEGDAFPAHSLAGAAPGGEDGTCPVLTADGKHYGLFQVIEFQSEPPTLTITWRYPAGKLVANASSDLTEQDVATIAAQPQQAIRDALQHISALLKPGTWERTGNNTGRFLAIRCKQSYNDPRSLGVP